MAFTDGLVHEVLFSNGSLRTAQTQAVTRTQRVHTSGNLEILAPPNRKSMGTSGSVVKLNEAENRKGSKLHRSPYC